MKPKILIIDDDIITLKVLKNYLEDDFDILTENAGHRFIENMDMYESVDMLLIDTEMPVVNGKQAFEKILDNPQMRNVKTAFMSSIPNPKVVDELVEMGAAGCIVKTSPKEQLIAQIKDILKNDDEIADNKSIIVMYGDVGELANMKAILSEAGYDVKAVRYAYDAVKYMNTHKVDLIVIGSDLSGARPQELYAAMSESMYKYNVQSMIIDKACFSKELLDRVSTALG